MVSQVVGVISLGPAHGCLFHRQIRSDVYDFFYLLHAVKFETCYSLPVHVRRKSNEMITSSSVHRRDNDHISSNINSPNDTTALTPRANNEIELLLIACLFGLIKRPSSLPHVCRITGVTFFKRPPCN